MSRQFAAFEFVLDNPKNEEDNLESLGITKQNRYRIVRLTQDPLTFDEATYELNEYKFKHPTKTRLEVRNIEDFKNIKYIFMA